MDAKVATVLAQARANCRQGEQCTCYARDPRFIDHHFWQCVNWIGPTYRGRTGDPA